MRLKVEPLGHYFYPDISGVCDPPQFSNDHLDTLTNPIVIIEVLSPSTERYDRGAKFHAYQQVDSLQDYVLIAQDKPHVDYYHREGDGWTYTAAVGLDASLRLKGIGGTLDLAAVYEAVAWDT